jgi:hypothetical protein
MEGLRDIQHASNMQPFPGCYSAERLAIFRIRSINNERWRPWDPSIKFPLTKHWRLLPSCSCSSSPNPRSIHQRIHDDPAIEEPFHFWQGIDFCKFNVFSKFKSPFRQSPVHSDVRNLSFAGSRHTLLHITMKITGFKFSIYVGHASGSRAQSTTTFNS